MAPSPSPDHSHPSPSNSPTGHPSLSSSHAPPLHILSPQADGEMIFNMLREQHALRRLTQPELVECATLVSDRLIDPHYALDRFNAGREFSDAIIASIVGAATDRDSRARYLLVAFHTRAWQCFLPAHGQHPDFNPVSPGEFAGLWMKVSTSWLRQDSEQSGPAASFERICGTLASASLIRDFQRASLSPTLLAVLAEHITPDEGPTPVISSVLFPNERVSSRALNFLVSTQGGTRHWVEIRPSESLFHSYLQEQGAFSNRTTWTTCDTLHSAGRDEDLFRTIEDSLRTSGLNPLSAGGKREAVARVLNPIIREWMDRHLGRDVNFFERHRLDIASVNLRSSHTDADGVFLVTVKDHDGRHQFISPETDTLGHSDGAMALLLEISPSSTDTLAIEIGGWCLDSRAMSDQLRRMCSQPASSIFAALLLNEVNRYREARQEAPLLPGECTFQVAKVFMNRQSELFGVLVAHQGGVYQLGIAREPRGGFIPAERGFVLCGAFDSTFERRVTAPSA